MDASLVAALAIEAGFNKKELAALHSRLERFAGLVLALRDKNQAVQMERLQEFWAKYSLTDIQELADSGELEKLLPTFEILPEDDSPIDFAGLKPIDLRNEE
jgi:hypothetical protein